MQKRGKYQNGRDAFYTRLAIYLHIFKHQTRENLTALFGVPNSTVREWVKEFSRPRLESILKNFHLAVGDESEALSLEGDTAEEIRQLLLKQARNGSTTAAKILLDLEAAEKKSGEEPLTVEKTVALMRQLQGPIRCSKCGHVEGFKSKEKSFPP
jgi:transposase-like protein